MPASDLRLKGSLCLRIDCGEQTTGWVVESNLKGEEMFGQTEGARARVHDIYIYCTGWGTGPRKRSSNNSYAHKALTVWS